MLRQTLLSAMALVAATAGSTAQASPHSRKTIQVAVRHLHTCAVLESGELKCWGTGSLGRLGNDSETTIGDDSLEVGDGIPVVPLNGRHVIQVAVGDFNTCVILDGGSVQCWGYNAYGQLGLGTIAGNASRIGDQAGEMAALSDIDLGSNAGARQISVGGNHVCAVFGDGALKCWGLNDYGQLGRSSGNSGGAQSIGDGATEMGAFLAPVELGKTVLQVSAGTSFTCALLSDASVKCWGRNDHGQLGLGLSTNQNVGDGSSEVTASLATVDLGRSAVQIAAGDNHACALLDNGRVKCWGSNAEGACGLEDYEDDDPFNRGDAAGEMGSNLPYVDLGTGRYAVSISAGNGITCALLDNGKVKCWGSNSHGDLGLPGGLDINETNKGDDNGEMSLLSYIPLGTDRSALGVVAGGSHVCAILDNGEIKCWGDNTSGQLGHGDSLDFGDGLNEMNSLAVTALGNTEVSRARALACGYDHSCAVLASGNLKCWGLNDAGQLGLENSDNQGDDDGEMGDTLTRVDLGANSSLDLLASGVDGGVAYTCMRSTTGVVKCWGANGQGALGQGDSVSRGASSDEMGDSLEPIGGEESPLIFTSIATGSWHACGRLADGATKCWGYNGEGQLGLGDTSSRGDASGEPASLASVNLGSGRTAIQLALGEAHTCALLDNHTVKCWGYGAAGALGQNGIDATDTIGESSSSDVANISPVFLGAGRTAQEISAGEQFTCALLDNGRIKCWGSNDHGQLGQGDTSPRGVSGGQMNGLDAIDLGTDTYAVHITAGSAHVCAQLTTGRLRCWGANRAAQLGLESTNDMGDGSGLLSATLVDLGDHIVRAVSAGRAHTCALREDGLVSCWGDNESGQLGMVSDPQLWGTWGDAPGQMGEYVTVADLGGDW